MWSPVWANNTEPAALMSFLSLSISSTDFTDSASTIQWIIQSFSNEVRYSKVRLLRLLHIKIVTLLRHSNLDPKQLLSMKLGLTLQLPFVRHSDVLTSWMYVNVSQTIKLNSCQSKDCLMFLYHLTLYSFLAYYYMYYWLVPGTIKSMSSQSN